MYFNQNPFSKIRKYIETCYSYILISHNNLFGRKYLPPIFLKNRPNSNPYCLCKLREDPAKSYQNQLILLSFGKREDTGEGDNLDGHCFVLRDLIPMNIIKKVMTVKLKMCTTNKIFGKIFV